MRGEDPLDASFNLALEEDSETHFPKRELEREDPQAMGEILRSPAPIWSAVPTPGAHVQDPGGLWLCNDAAGTWGCASAGRQAWSRRSTS